MSIPLVRPYDRQSHFYEELGNGEGSEDERLLKLDECFKQGWLNADQVRDAMDF